MVQSPPPRYVAKFPLRPLAQSWAPAWFYSALNWLGNSYYDASNVQQSFSLYMAGSDVDPYSRLGSTRLFMIFSTRETFRLTLAADVNSSAPSSGGTTYPNTDEGITQMYTALSASPIFSSVRYCYIPGRLGPNPNPDSLKLHLQAAPSRAATTPPPGCEPSCSDLRSPRWSLSVTSTRHRTSRSTTTARQ